MQTTEEMRLTERMAAFLVIAFVSLFGWVTIAPYFMVIPIESHQLIIQQITTIQNIMLAVVAFYFGQSQGNLRKDATIGTLAKTAQVAGAQLASPKDGIVVPPGDTATVAATEAGTVIKPGGSDEASKG